MSREGSAVTVACFAWVELVAISFSSPSSNRMQSVARTSNSAVSEKVELFDSEHSILMVAKEGSDRTGNSSISFQNGSFDSEIVVVAWKPSILFRFLGKEKPTWNFSYDLKTTFAYRVGSTGNCYSRSSL